MQNAKNVKPRRSINILAKDGTPRQNSTKTARRPKSPRVLLGFVTARQKAFLKVCFIVFSNLAIKGKNIKKISIKKSERAVMRKSMVFPSAVFHSPEKYII